MGELSQRIIVKLSGLAWEQLRGQFMHISRLLLAVSPDADSDLHPNYVKFTVHSDPNSPAYAAVWLKSSKQLIVGLALPEEHDAEELGPAPPRTFYRGLNKYFVVECGGVVPNRLAEWVELAHQNALSVEPLTGFMGQVAAKDSDASPMLP